MTRRFALLVSPVSAGGKPLKVLPEVTAELDRLEAPYRTIETRGLDHAADEAAAAAKAGETVATLGGDGLVRPVAGALRDSPAALAILPGGRGNDFARVLGLPLEPAGATRVAVQGVERLVDVGEVDGVPFIGIASLGFDSDANRIANEAKLVRGNLVYLYAAMRALVGWKHASFQVTIDGERHVVTGWSVGVGNSKAYGGGMYAMPQAELDDGLLDIVTCAKSSRLAFLRVVARTFKGTHLELPQISTYRGAEVTVDADRPFDIYADGDPVGRTPATLRVRQRCLKVIVPG
ncbi:MAG: diacylglycerol/lipid kinase family protein [Thermoleophilaceae bacterium]